MKSIQSKILVVVIAGLLILTVVVSAVAVSMTHEVMHTDADRILKNATEREAAYINDVLGDVAKSSNVMVHYATSEVEQIEDFKYLVEFAFKSSSMFMLSSMTDKKFPLKFNDLMEVNKAISRCSEFLDKIQGE